MSSKKDKEHRKNSSAPAEPDSDEAFVLSNDPLVQSVQRQVISVFEVFDQGGQQTVDVREVGTMCRALDLCPTEADVHEIIGCVEESGSKGLVKMNTFVNHMAKVICDGKYRPVLFDDILNTFQSMDKEKKGTLDPVRFKETLMREGEPFTSEEADEMFNFAVEKIDKMIHYADYVDKLYRGFGAQR